MEPKNQVIWITGCKDVAIYISIYFTKSRIAPVSHKVHQKQKKSFVKDMHWTTWGLHWEWLGMTEPTQKMFLSENVIFRGLWLSLGHFGQQVPQSPVCQIQNGLSTSSLPPSIMFMFIYYKLTQGPTHFFQWEF